MSRHLQRYLNWTNTGPAWRLIPLWITIALPLAAYGFLIYPHLSTYTRGAIWGATLTYAATSGGRAGKWFAAGLLAFWIVTELIRTLA